MIKSIIAGVVGGIVANHIYGAMKHDRQLCETKYNLPPLTTTLDEVKNNAGTPDLEVETETDPVRSTQEGNAPTPSTCTPKLTAA